MTLKNFYAKKTFRVSKLRKKQENWFHQMQNKIIKVEKQFLSPNQACVNKKTKTIFQQKQKHDMILSCIFNFFCKILCVKWKSKCQSQIGFITCIKTEVFLGCVNIFIIFLNFSKQLKEHLKIKKSASIIFSIIIVKNWIQKQRQKQAYGECKNSRIKMLKICQLCTAA